MPGRHAESVLLGQARRASGRPDRQAAAAVATQPDDVGVDCQSATGPAAPVAAVLDPRQPALVAAAALDLPLVAARVADDAALLLGGALGPPFLAVQLSGAAGVVAAAAG